jgi:flavin reductase (DIM6/NTAB) family NADH-FMN oxidoreductase RutF
VIGPDEFRHVLGHFATGVTVVTTADADGRPAGLTVSAFASVSLEPPLVLVCVDHKAQTYPTMLEGGRFAVNVLSADQAELSRRFASSDLGKFEGVRYRRGTLDLPLLEGCLAHLECSTVNTHVNGDHTIFVGLVERAWAATGEPLLYYRGRYERLREERA